MSGDLDIVGFGSVAIDDQLYVDQPLSAGKGRVISKQTDFGGNVATALVSAANLGAAAGFIGWLSGHPDDEHLIENLNVHGVHTSCASFAIDARPVRSSIVVGSDGDRFIAYSDDDMFRESPVSSAERFQRAQVLLIDSYAVSSLEAVRLAVDTGLLIVADIEWVHGEATTQLSDLCHHLIVPWNYASEVTQSIDPQIMLERLWSPHRSVVVITRGEHGAYFRYADDSNNSWHQPAFDVEVIDTTGCGDCFHGAYAVGLTLGYDSARCVRFASAAAAIAASCKGGQSAVLSATRDTVSQMLDSSDSPNTKRIQ